MTVDNIIELAKNMTNTTTSEVTKSVNNDLALEYLNIIYHDLENTITTKINEDNRIPGQTPHRSRIHGYNIPRK